MVALEVSETKAELIDKTEDAAWKVLHAYLTDKREGGDDIRVAQAVVSAAAKNRQTLTARELGRFGIAQATLTPDELRKYAMTTQPEIKKLPAGK